MYQRSAHMPAAHTSAAARRQVLLDEVATRGYIYPMKTMGIRELKDRLSEVVRAVKAGEHVLVTDRGTVVSELFPPGRPGTDAGVPSGLARLAERGIARLGAPNDPNLYR